MSRDFGRAFLALLVCAAFGAAITGCRSTGSNDDPPEGFRITKFIINDVEGVINQNDRTIEVVLPYGTAVGEFEPTVEFFGAKINPAPGTSVDFSEQPVTYTVFSRDGSAFSYFVTVTLEIPNTNEILFFALDEVTALPAEIINVDEETGVINITVPYGTTGLDNKTTVIAHNGDSINPVPGKPQDFRAPVTYEVYSMRGEKRVYTVQVTIAPNIEADITHFTLSVAEGVITGTDIAVTMPFGTSLASLTPVITVSDGASVSPAGAQNFSSAITYTVTAADNTTTKTYTITVTVAANSDKAISSFTVEGQQGTSVINESAGSIAVTLPANMPKTSLKPVIVLTGGTVNPASGTAKDFTNAVKYTVTAADNSTKDYTVTVTNAAAESITFKTLTANGASWTTETTTLMLEFSADMSAALKAEHITLTAASGTITKGALTNKNSGKYELAVSGIPGNNVEVSVTVAESSIYGFKITGNPKTANVFKAPAPVTWSPLTANGADKTQDTTTLTFTFNTDVTGFAADDITLTGAGAKKGAVSGSGKTWTLTVTGINANNVDLTASLSKTGFSFNPASRTVKVYKKLSTDAGLSSLAVEGYNLDPAFSASTTDYTVTVDADAIQVTATANDAGAKLVYVENNNVPVTSGKSFDSKTLIAGTNTITVQVTAEDGSTTKSYMVTADVVKNNDKSISSFSVEGQQGTSVINENDGTIAVTLPANMPKTSLKPVIVLTGGTVNPASGAAQNFSNEVKYTVTAADNSTKDYTVTVTNAATNVTFKTVTANGSLLVTTTTMTLQFSVDMGDALKAEHITLNPALTKGALTNKNSGKYELAVSGIPGNKVSVSVTVAESSIYGYKVTGNPQSTYVFRFP